jgi:protein-S-isoprenylcysteine O-methyltransferase Ste14
MQTAWLLAGAIAFSIIAPGTIAGFIPYAITRWRVQSHWLGLPGQIAGGLMLAAGVLVLAESFLRFVFVGRGTPAPVAPPEGLVVSGFYRYTRNPMYVAVVSAIVGQALLFGSANLLAYAVLIWLLVSGFVLLYEEPVLRRKFGRSYDVYRGNVPRWWPRSKPWRGE